MSAIHPATDDLIVYLNRLAELDPVFVTELIGRRIHCNRGIANHPSIQTRRTSREAVYQCTILGVLNGFCGILDDPASEPRLWGLGPITAVLDDAGTVLRFERTDRISMGQFLGGRTVR